MATKKPIFQRRKPPVFDIEAQQKYNAEMVAIVDASAREIEGMEAAAARQRMTLGLQAELEEQAAAEEAAAEEAAEEAAAEEAEVEMDNEVQSQTKEPGQSDKPVETLRKKDVHTRSPKEQLRYICGKYLLSNNSKYNAHELEAKFGTRGIKPITRMDYNNVIQKLKSLGFTSSNESGSYSLKIQPEFLDIKTGEFKSAGDFDRFRVEIAGISAIQQYCNNNDLESVNASNVNQVQLMRKVDVREDDAPIGSANFDDFNFRVTFKNEISIAKNGKIGKQVFDNWQTSKKIFRYINRVTFIKQGLPIKIDLSIVRTSTKSYNHRLIKTYNIDESNVFNNVATFEIEVEIINTNIKLLYNSIQELSDGLQKVIKYVLCGLQQTNYPVSYPEQKLVLDDYFTMLFEEEFIKKHKQYIPKSRAYPSDFIGPGLVALQRKNIALIDGQINIPNITKPYSYCVTDKADGARCLLFINNKGRIYLINMNMNVIFTGAITSEEKCYNSLIDGELILHNKEAIFINLFVAFDIYYLQSLDVRAIPFMKVPDKDDKYFEQGTRLEKLKAFIHILKPKSILKDEDGEEIKSPITIQSKKFYPLFGDNSGDVNTGELVREKKYNIFEACSFILSRIRNGLYPYTTDGLIFTPTLLGVGSNKVMSAGPKRSNRWESLFKWKPSEATTTFPMSYNTIDFLVFTKKGSDGKDIITPIFENGVNMNEYAQFNQYKTLELAVGFDVNKHGYLNPCQDLLDDKFTEPEEASNEDVYQPKRFYPSDPYDLQAGMCNIMLDMDSSGNQNMFTEEHQLFEDQTVVEFKYDMSKPGLWKWVPLRVRYEKTADFKQGLKSFGNDYITANNNWYSIHNPITEKMLSTGEDIPTVELNDDIYYNNVTTEKSSIAMRDFHNLYVKKMLIQKVCKRGNTLIDFGCGKGGDFPKWIAAHLSFVLGIDVANDNLENRLNGACARFLNYKKTNKDTPWALFVNGDASLNIRNGINMFNDKANSIVKTVFGTGEVQPNIGPAVQRQVGTGVNGFDVSSMQFALHYMFQNKNSFYNFMRNVSECTKLNGYFISTCYDGKTIFNMLKQKAVGQSEEIYTNDKKIWSIDKNYESLQFNNNDSSLGYKISVYQDSINQTLPEWLVNFDFLTETMEKYGFALISRDEAKHIGLPSGSGMFIELFNSMENEIKRNPTSKQNYGDANKMTPSEKRISFLNRFFVYKKIRTINAEKLTKILLEQIPDDLAFERSGTLLAREAVETAIIKTKPSVRKLTAKLKLSNSDDEQPAEHLKTKKKRTKKLPAIELEIDDN